MRGRRSSSSSSSHRSRFLVCFMANQKGRGASPSPIGAASLFFHELRLLSRPFSASKGPTTPQERKKPQRRPRRVSPSHPLALASSSQLCLLLVRSSEKSKIDSSRRSFRLKRFNSRRRGIVSAGRVNHGYALIADSAQWFVKVYSNICDE